MEYALAMSDTKKALADVLGVEEELIDSEFVESHLEDIEKAATGDAEAIDKLRASMDEEIIANIKLNRPDLTNLDSLDQEVKSALENALSDLKIPDIEVGATLRDEAFLKAANNIVNEAGMTADEANAYFAGIGYTPLYAQTEVEGNTNMPNSQTTMEVTSIGAGSNTVDLGLFGEVSLP
jgi:hypothetical protein